MDFAVQLPPARLGGVFMDELPKLYSIIKRDMWLSGKRYIKKQSNFRIMPSMKSLHAAMVFKLIFNRWRLSNCQHQQY
jgi:hypothetical protein